MVIEKFKETLKFNEYSLITQCRHFIGTQQNGESSHLLPLLTMDAMLLVTSLCCCCCFGGGVVILISWLEEMLSVCTIFGKQVSTPKHTVFY
jgi:hypothetical protein